VRELRRVTAAEISRKEVAPPTTLGKRRPRHFLNRRSYVALIENSVHLLFLDYSGADPRTTDLRTIRSIAAM